MRTAEGNYILCLFRLARSHRAGTDSSNKSLRTTDLPCVCFGFGLSQLGVSFASPH